MGVLFIVLVRRQYNEQISHDVLSTLGFKLITAVSVYSMIITSHFTIVILWRLKEPALRTNKAVSA